MTGTLEPQTHPITPKMDFDYDGASVRDLPYRGSSDELEFRSKVIIYHAAQGKKLGYRVGLAGEGSLFCESIEEALRRVIHLLGLETKDLMIFDTIPGIVALPYDHAEDEFPDEEDEDSPGVPGPAAA